MNFRESRIIERQEVNPRINDSSQEGSGFFISREHPHISLWYVAPDAGDEAESQGCIGKIEQRDNVETQI